MKDDKLLSILSAFVPIDTTGSASDLLDAVDIIRQKYSDAFIFDSSILDGRGTESITSRLDGKGPLVILPANYQIKERCTYIGVSLESIKLSDYKWLMRSIGSTIRQYHGQNAR